MRAMRAMKVKPDLAVRSSCEPMGTGTRHMWRFQKRSHRVVLVFKCEGCGLTVSVHSRAFWGRPAVYRHLYP